MRLHIEIRDKIDGTALWNDIEKFGVNETELIDVTLVYGNVEHMQAMSIIMSCMKYSTNLAIELNPS